MKKNVRQVLQFMAALRAVSPDSMGYLNGDFLGDFADDGFDVTNYDAEQEAQNDEKNGGNSDE